jgi:hypothetical protein
VIGLAFVVAAVAYLIALVVITLFTYSAVRKRLSTWYAAGAALAAFLAVYLPIFWDHIPTVIAHRYYCAAEANFTVGKTVEQWRRDNADVVSSLRHTQTIAGEQFGEYRRFPLNQRIAVDRRSDTKVFLTVERREGRIVDVRNNDVLASYTDFRSGPTPVSSDPGWWKLWLVRRSCDLTDNGLEAPFAALAREWTKLGETRK